MKCYLCPECNKEVPKILRFCPICGFRNFSVCELKEKNKETSVVEKKELFRVKKYILFFTIVLLISIFSFIIINIFVNEFKIWNILIIGSFLYSLLSIVLLIFKIKDYLFNKSVVKNKKTKNEIDDSEEKLLKLKSLLDKKLISKEDYNLKKEEILRKL